MPSQIIFLFDLDQCIPLRCGLSSEELEQQMSFLKHVCLKILCSASSLEGSETGSAALAHFGFRFYSSTEYFLVPQDVDSATFHELSEETFSLFESILSEKFEHLWQTSKSNSFNSEALAQHIESACHKPHAQTLRKALEEIAVLYNWDRPMLHSPVKRDQRQCMDENVVYIFTKLPNTIKELNQFLGNKQILAKIQPNVLFEEVFNQSTTSNVKSIMNVFKGDANVRVTTIDTASTHSKIDLDLDKRVKQTFHKMLKHFRGGVISIDAFKPDVWSPELGIDPTHKLRTSTMLAAYISEEQEKRGKHNLHRPGSIKVDSGGESLSSLNFEPLKEEFSNLASQRTPNITLKGLVPATLFGAAQVWEAHFCIWPPRDQLSWGTLMSKMIVQRQNLLVSLGDDQLGVISPSYNQSGILSLLSKTESSFYLLLMNFKNSTLAKLEPELPASVQQILQQHLKEQFDKTKVAPKREHAERLHMPFQADCFDSWKVPESRPFLGAIEAAKKKDAKPSSGMVRDLQRAYLPPRVTFLMDRKLGNESNNEEDPFCRRQSDDGIVSHVVNARANPVEAKKKLSRGAELMRLGSKNAELRRYSSEEPSAATGTRGVSVPAKGPSDFDIEKESIRSGYEKELAGLLDKEDDEALFTKLMELQWKLLHHVGECNAAIVALAEETVNSLLKHNKAVGKSQDELESVLEANFFVDPAVVAQRKTSKVPGGRIRDHKLQAIYRIEVHWILANQKKQTEVEEQILAHLRQISVWDSPDSMVSFLNDIVTPTYINRSPDLLHMIYEELNLPSPAGVRDLFSPVKTSDCSSVPPCSVESARSSTSGALDLHSRSVGLAKLRRMSSFDSKKLLQINVAVDKKGKSKNAAPSVPAPPKTKKTGRTPMKKAARRNLSFDAFKSPRKKVGPSTSTESKRAGNKTPKKKGQTPRKNAKTPVKNLKTPVKIFKTPVKHSKTPIKTPKKSPRKTPMKSPEKSARETPMKNNKTPKKQSFVTPLKMTPGKSHHILAPETPSLKGGQRRKSDGTLLVTESPDLDLIKHAKTTPRRIRASVALHKKTSFYSGNVSRNLIKAEEMLDASRLQSSFLSRESQIVAPVSRRVSDPNESISKFLFPHLAPQDGGNSFSIRDLVEDDKKKSSANEANTKQYDLFSDDEDMFASPKAKVAKLSTDSDNFRRPLRRLFNDDDEDLELSTSEHVGPSKSLGKKIEQKLGDGSRVEQRAKNSLSESEPDMKVPPRRSQRLDSSMSDQLTPTKCGPKTPVKRQQIETKSEFTEASRPETDPGTPTFADRPSRRKNSTVRFGIDDIPLNEAILSPFGKSGRGLKRSMTPSKMVGTPPSSRKSGPMLVHATSPSLVIKDMETNKNPQRRRSSRGRLFSDSDADSSKVEDKIEIDDCQQLKLNSSNNRDTKTKSKLSLKSFTNFSSSKVYHDIETGSEEFPDVFQLKSPSDSTVNTLRSHKSKPEIEEAKLNKAKKQNDDIRVSNLSAGVSSELNSLNSCSTDHPSLQPKIILTDVISPKEQKQLRSQKSRSSLTGASSNDIDSKSSEEAIKQRLSLTMKSSQAKSESPSTHLRSQLEPKVVLDDVTIPIKSSSKNLRSLKSRSSLETREKTRPDNDHFETSAKKIQEHPKSKLSLRRHSKISDSSKSEIRESDENRVGKMIFSPTCITLSDDDDDEDDLMLLPQPRTKLSRVRTSPQTEAKGAPRSMNDTLEVKDDSNSNSPTIISFSKVSLSTNSSAAASVIELSTESPRESSLDLSFGQKIKEISHSTILSRTRKSDLRVNKVRDISSENNTTQDIPSVVNVRNEETGSPKTRKLKRLRSESKLTSPSLKKKKRLKIEFTGSPPSMTDHLKSKLYKMGRTRVEPKTPGSFSSSRDLSPPPSTDSGSLQTPNKSPGKYWSIVGTTESPSGEIKMKLNRQKKPNQFVVPTSRISRRMTTEVGIPLEDLMTIISKSPSPKKGLGVSIEKENLLSRIQDPFCEPSPSSSRDYDDARVLLRKIDSNLAAAAGGSTSQTLSSVEKKMKFSPLTSRGLFTLTTSPIIDKERGRSEHKQRRVNKRLYVDDDN